MGLGPNASLHFSKASTKKYRLAPVGPSGKITLGSTRLVLSAQGDSTENFRSLTNPNTQLMIGFLVIGFFLAHIGSKHIKTCDTSQEKPSGKRFLVFMLLYAWALTSLVLAGSPYGLIVVIIDIVILTYFYIKKDVELCLTTQSR